MIGLLIAAVWLFIVFAAWAVCANAGRLDRQAGRDIPWIPYYCTRFDCAAELPSREALDRHLVVDHNFGGES